MRLKKRTAVLKKERCPQKARHTKCPEGYLQWHAWADKKSKTHWTERCPGCGLYAIWVPKKKRRRMR